MKIFGYEINKNVQEISNVDVQQREVERIVDRITRQQLTRTRQDIEKWRSAMSRAEGTLGHEHRIELIRTYNDSVLDSHLSSIIQTRILKVLGHESHLVDKSGNASEMSGIFNTEWFLDFVKLSMESIFWGHSLIQLGSIIDDKPETVELVPREYVIPERHGVMKQLRNTGTLIDYTSNPQSKWLVEVGNRNDLGLLAKATPHAIWKKNAIGSWAEFAEVFGQPTRIGKTSSSNAENRKNLESMLENMGSSAWGVFDTDDELMFIESTKTDAHAVYEQMIATNNSEMSKLILGQTMTSDNGSSRSQSEVHERILNDYFKHDLVFITNVVNNKLIPLLKSHGVQLDGLIFKYDTTEKLDLKSQFEIDKELLKTYEIDPEYFVEKYGTPVVEKLLPTKQEMENVFFENSISKYYE